jgi:hypothetical protein
MEAKTFRLLSPAKDGKVLVVNLKGALWYDAPGTQGVDDEWMTIKSREPLDEGVQGYYLIAANYKLVLEYNPAVGENVTAIPFTGLGDHTTWYISPDAEIYTISADGDEKKYMWSILDKVFVTQDEHLAEKWKAVTTEGKKMKIKPQCHKMNIWMKVLLIILFIGLAAALAFYLIK